MATKFLILLLLIISVSTPAQVDKSSKRPKPVGEVSASTKDGKQVVLKSDGTWTYAPAQPNTGSIYLEVKLPNSFGDISPKSIFYLHTRSLKDIIATTGLLDIYRDEQKARAVPSSDARAVTPTFLFFTMEHFQQLYPIFSNEAKKDLTKYLVAQRSAILSYREPIVFDDIPRGKYFLTGFIKNSPPFYAPSSNFRVWEIELDLNLKVTHVLLNDQNATLTIESTL